MAFTNPLKNKTRRLFYLSIGLWMNVNLLYAQANPELALLQKKGIYVPDFSYAGYHNSEKALPGQLGVTLLLTDYGAMANDEIDDSKALQAALKAAHEMVQPVTIRFPAGRLILSEIFYIERSNILLRGAGSGALGTVLYFPFPLSMLADPESLKELREYLVKYEKIQKEPENNVYAPFSQYAWSGGFFWTKVPGVRVKSYLKEYDQPSNVLSKLTNGRRGTTLIEVSDASQLKEGDVVELQWFNKEGELGSILKELYGSTDIRIGSHHWRNPETALVRQQSSIRNIKGNKVTLADELMMDIRPEWTPQLVEWKHLKEVGFAHFRVEFPLSIDYPHHVEAGFNAFFLTRVFNSWIQDVKIKNADAGVLTEEAANITVSNIETLGAKKAHYSVAMSGVHNVLVKQLKVKNSVRHPLSFNTYATKSVYTNCEVLTDPVLDQHSGCNHQNLFDNIKVEVTLNGERSYPLFAGGGAGYWKPSHGAYNTFWNIEARFQDGFDRSEKIILKGMKDGPEATLVGVHANSPVGVEYGPEAFIIATGKSPDIKSLFQYQLEQRLLSLIKKN
ncbi:hypothetical protein FNH22_09120 [Fulvivirga sp. M361]|uniref:hypothetical protein n=1 Tax=Fulvivirga sp. M361 TaxID=2594266 RepID=UPI00117ADE8F|nr:hypothetical protein [Fulvivirga sp. M361]TRX60198.1 hypothetical protein FNH22_09120 [Fulvivirga sp. M361]